MKGNVLEYKGYYSAIAYDAEEQVLHGKIEMINDLVTFEADRATEIEKAFREVVDGYLKMCEELSREPQKPYKGLFNVRTSPDLHKKAAIEALKAGMSLNQFVNVAIQNLVDNNHNNIYDELHASERRIKETFLTTTNALWNNATVSRNLMSLEVK